MRLLPLLLLASACAAGSAREADLSGELAGRNAGTSEECVSASPGANLVARDARTLVYRRGDTIWVNRLAAACPGLDPMSTLIVEAHGSQYCRGDQIRAVETGRSIPGPTCLLGAFTPYRR
ncbi:MAG: hypothetical protein QOJ27_1828 [Sphingomonadales bacterium]|nr:hypothetical protein [Sphingomonadales bacterium]